jgi:hypothetical protein
MTFMNEYSPAFLSPTDIICIVQRVSNGDDVSIKKFCNRTELTLTVHSD